MADTFNATVNSGSGHSYVQYSGTLDLTGNLTDSHYSQAMRIAESNNTDAGFFAVASGGAGTDGDIDVRLHVSNDRENWVDAGTLADLDGGGVSADGLAGGTGLEEFHSYEWARIEADGLASNDDDTVEWSLHCTKNTTDIPTYAGAQVEDSIE